MDTNALIGWKTDAWKDSNMVAWYAKRMLENSGSNRLKNRIETDLCEQFVTGRELLDVGIGTGRASLPLARKGFLLSGTDSSQAMLDECGRQAGNLPVKLVPGDVKALPFGDASFDSLISLNVMTHFPHVEEVLSEWKRVVRPGGRLVFDIYSLEHLCFSRGKDVTVAELIAQGADGFNMHLKAEHLVHIADALGLSIVALVPYGSLFCGEYRRHSFSKPLQMTHWWMRQLSWLAQDDALLECAWFLDRHWFGRLPAAFTGRFMVVLEQRPNPDGNAAWLARQRELTSRLTAPQPIRLEQLADVLDLPPDEWRRQFDAYMGRLRNRSIAYFLLTSCFGRLDAIDWLDFSPTHGAQMTRWLNAEQVDAAAIGLARGWHQNPAFAALAQVNGVDLACGLDYEVQKQILLKAMAAFGDGAV